MSFNKFRNDGSNENHKAHKKQRNSRVKLVKPAKENSWNNFDVKKITDNKPFWKTIKPNFTDKTLKDERIALVEDGNISSEEPDLAKLFNNYFGSIVGIDLECPHISQEYNTPVKNTIKIFENHTSI